MFSIASKNTKFKKLAKIKGGDQKNKYLVIKPYKYTLDDLKKIFLNRLNADQRKILEESVNTGFEPDDDYMKDIYYETLKEFEKLKRKGLRLHSGKFEKMIDPDTYERIYVCGASGSGKTYYSTKLIQQYLAYHKKHRNDNDFVLVSGVAPSEDLMDLFPLEISPEEIAMEGLPIGPVTDSIILFDDVFSIPNQQIKKALVSSVGNLIETNRHTRTHVIMINHLLTDGHNTRKILNESTSVVMFPNGSSRYGITKYLQNYENMETELIRRIVNLPSRSVTLVKNHQPNYILHDKGAFFI